MLLPSSDVFLLKRFSRIGGLFRNSKRSTQLFRPFSCRGGGSFITSQ